MEEWREKFCELSLERRELEKQISAMSGRVAEIKKELDKIISDECDKRGTGKCQK